MKGLHVLNNSENNKYLMFFEFVANLEYLRP
jgi:hypothetical protein